MVVVGMEVKQLSFSRTRDFNTASLPNLRCYGLRLCPPNVFMHEEFSEHHNVSNILIDDSNRISESETS